MEPFVSVPCSELCKCNLPLFLNSAHVMTFPPLYCQLESWVIGKERSHSGLDLWGTGRVGQQSCHHWSEMPAHSNWGEEEQCCGGETNLQGTTSQVFFVMWLPTAIPLGNALQFVPVQWLWWCRTLYISKGSPEYLPSLQFFQFWIEHRFNPWVLLIISSLKASFNILKFSAVFVPSLKQSLLHTHSSLKSAILQRDGNCRGNSTQPCLTLMCAVT